MRRVAFLLVLALSCYPGLAAAVSGVNVRWGKCYSDAGAGNRTFSCGTNNGSETAVFAFKLDHAKTDVTGIEVYVAVATAAPTIPAWWQFSSGGCRRGALSASPVLPSGSLNCVDWGQGTQQGGLAAYFVGNVAPNQARATIGYAVPSSTPVTLQPNQEYFACNLVISHANTRALADTAACAGCTVPAAIFFEGLRIATGVTSEDFTGPSNERESQWVTWQNGQLTNLLFPACPAGSLACQFGRLTTFGVSAGPQMRYFKAGAR